MEILSRDPFAWTIDKDKIENQLNTHYYHPEFIELIETIDRKINSGGFDKIELGHKDLTVVTSMLGFERETFKYSHKTEIPYLRFIT